jgi:predicted NBD/HSP70 family sugar kinase
LHKIKISGEIMLKLTELGQDIIKDSNRKKILNILYKNKEVTKQEISKLTGISIPTVINNINLLLEEGLVEEIGVATSTGGRKPVIIRFLSDSRFSFGVEITPSQVRVIRTNLNSEIKFDESFPIKGIDNFENIMSRISEIVNNHIIENKLSTDKILGIGFSLPGTVDEDKLTMELAPNMNFKNINFNKYRNNFDFPIYIENEANAAAFGEMILGIGKEMKNLIYISITQGIGTGIVIQDHLYKGKNKRAGEFGHMTIVPNGKQCNCGRKGCWELYASENILIDKYNDEIESRTDNPAAQIVSLDQFFTNVELHDSRALTILKEYLYYLSIGIQNIIFGLDPHYIIIGGSLSKFSDYFIEDLNELVFDKNNLFDYGDNKLFASKLKEDASILGASILPLQTMFFIYDKII